MEERELLSHSTSCIMCAMAHSRSEDERPWELDVNPTLRLVRPAHVLVPRPPHLLVGRRIMGTGRFSSRALPPFDATRFLGKHFTLWSLQYYSPTIDMDVESGNLGPNPVSLPRYPPLVSPCAGRFVIALLRVYFRGLTRLEPGS